MPPPDPDIIYHRARSHSFDDQDSFDGEYDASQSGYIKALKQKFTNLIYFRGDSESDRNVNQNCNSSTLPFT